MIPQIAKALSGGFTHKQILDFILKKFPQHSDKIKSALAAGFGADKIINFLSGGKKEAGKSNFPVNTEYAQTRQKDIERRENINKGAATAATLAAGALSAPLAASAISRALPSSLSGFLPDLMQQQQQAPMTPMPVPPVAPQQETSSIQNTQNPPIQTPIDINSIINKYPGFVSKIEEIKENDIPTIAAYFRNFHGPETKKLEKEVGQPFEKVIESYLANNPAKEPLIDQNKPENVEISQIDEEKSPEVEEVLTPHGLGEIKNKRNGKAIVEVDGKKHQVEEKNLLKPPKEAAIEALELIKSFTPEDMRSTHHMLNSYDEAENKAYFFFHNGSAYVVDDISPEEYTELSEEIEGAKTSGETVIGKWARGEGSRGAGYNKIVKGHREIEEEGKKKRKVQPGLAKPFRKLKVGYNLLAEWQRLLNEK